MSVSIGVFEFERRALCHRRRPGMAGQTKGAAAMGREIIRIPSVIWCVGGCRAAGIMQKHPFGRVAELCWAFWGATSTVTESGLGAVLLGISLGSSNIPQMCRSCRLTLTFWSSSWERNFTVDAHQQKGKHLKGSKTSPTEVTEVSDPRTPRYFLRGQ